MATNPAPARPGAKNGSGNNGSGGENGGGMIGGKGGGGNRDGSDGKNGGDEIGGGKKGGNEGVAVEAAGGTATFWLRPPTQDSMYSMTSRLSSPLALDPGLGPSIHGLS